MVGVVDFKSNWGCNYHWRFFHARRRFPCIWRFTGGIMHP